MATRTVSYELVADEAKVLDAYRQVRASMVETERTVEKTNRKQREQEGVIDRLRKGVQGFHGDLMSLVAGYATFQGLTSLAQQYIGALKEIEDKQASMGKGLLQVAQDTPGGPKAIDERLKDVAKRGTAMGVSPDQMAMIDDWAGDVAGRFGDAVVKDLASREITLEKIGFDPEATQDAMAALVKQGTTPEEASRLIAGAFMNTDLKTSSMAKIPTAIEKFGSAREGLSVAAGMADMGIFTSKELPSKIADIGGAFAQGGKLEKALSAKYAAVGLNYADVSTETKLADVEQLGWADTKKLQKKFGLSESQADTMMEVMKRRDTITYARGQIDQTPAGFAETRLEDLKGTKSLEAYYGKQEQEAKAGASALYGGQSDLARRYGAMSREIGDTLMNAGSDKFLAPLFYDKKTGEANALATVPAIALDWFGRGGNIPNPFGDEFPGMKLNPMAGFLRGNDSGSGASDLGGKIDKLTNSLDRNTEVTERNTAEGGSGGDAAPSLATRRNAN